MNNWQDRVIDDYAAKYGEDPTTRSVVDACPLASGEAVLDIGCGTGASLRHALSKGAAKLVGVDLDRMILHAKEASLGMPIDYFSATAEALPFEDVAFDGILAVNSIHHWNDRAKGLSEARRVLKPGGWIAIGGEGFDEGSLPDGQEYVADLERFGFERIQSEDISHGFVTVAWRGR